MTQQHAPAGWYPDPTGQHEYRYFDGQWTQYVSTRGVNSIDPLAASPAPVAGRPRDLQGARSGSERSPRFRLAIAGGAVVAAAIVGITLAVTLSGGSSGHGFCTDAAAVNKDHLSSLSGVDTQNLSLLSRAASQFDTLAAESPSPQDAADLRYVANWLRSVTSGNLVAAQSNEPQVEAAAIRADSYIRQKCALNIGGS